MARKQIFSSSWLCSMAIALRVDRVIECPERGEAKATDDLDHHCEQHCHPFGPTDREQAAQCGRESRWQWVGGCDDWCLRQALAQVIGPLGEPLVVLLAETTPEFSSTMQMTCICRRWWKGGRSSPYRADHRPGRGQIRVQKIPALAADLQESGGPKPPGMPLVWSPTRRAPTLERSITANLRS
jgi:hypothetical protein